MSSWEDYTVRGEVTINTTRQTFGPFPTDRGTYKDLLRQWDTTLTSGLIELHDADGREHSYRCRDVTEIIWKPNSAEITRSA